jgi:hypothetical protein
MVCRAMPGAESSVLLTASHNDRDTVSLTLVQGQV